MREETVVACLKVLYHNLTGGSDETQEEPWLGQWVSGPRFEPGASPIGLDIWWSSCVNVNIDRCSKAVHVVCTLLLHNCRASVRPNELPGNTDVSRYHGYHV